ncbi:MAG: OmpH family outer membrane protein [Bacteroidales bacterium]|jgi:outer membrane protein|nr:OmpH family outer membrane protein [Bacteroidales bacterium]
MKQTPLILSIIALVAVAALGIIQLTADGNGKKKAAEGEVAEVTAKEGAIVWYDLDRVLNEYDMANDLRSVVETKAQSIQDEINRRGNKLQSDVNKFQSDLDKGVLIRSVAEQRNQKLQQQQANFNNYAAQKQQEMAEEQQVMMNQIADAIKTFIDQFNEEHKYAMIIATQGGILPAPVSCGDPDLDITDALLAGLNSEYVKNKGKDTTTPAASTDTKAE